MEAQGAGYHSTIAARESIGLCHHESVIGADNFDCSAHVVGKRFGREGRASTQPQSFSRSQRQHANIGVGRRVRRAEYELSQLDDRELNDLGIARGDIPRIARESVKL